MTYALGFGTSSDIIVPGDFTGDNKTDIVFWRPSNGFWFVLRSEDFSFFAFPFGTSGDIPVAADFDGGRPDDPGGGRLRRMAPTPIPLADAAVDWSRRAM